MCGRFGATFQYRDIKTRWNLYGDLSGFAPRYNIAPSQDVPVIVRNEGRNDVRSMRWGLVPSWAPDPSMGQRTLVLKRCSKSHLSSSSCQRGDV
jgi:putative SOS response-associated peptidase YedK